MTHGLTGWLTYLWLFANIEMLAGSSVYHRSVTNNETEVTHLWEPDHPYYCAEGNYYANDCHLVSDSWTEFLDEAGDQDPDRNLVFRWDWVIPDAEDLEPGDDARPKLLTFWVGQRKAMLWSRECPVAPEDEPAVREWLTGRAKTIAALWAPIALQP